MTFSVDTPRLGAALGALGHFDIRTLTSTPPTLEELFLRHYGDEVPADDEGRVSEVRR